MMTTITATKLETRVGCECVREDLRKMCAIKRRSGPGATARLLQEAAVVINHSDSCVREEDVPFSTTGNISPAGGSLLIDQLGNQAHDGRIEKEIGVRKMRRNRSSSSVASDCVAREHNANQEKAFEVARKFTRRKRVIFGYESPRCSRKKVNKSNQQASNIRIKSNIHIARCKHDLLTFE